MWTELCVRIMKLTDNLGGVGADNLGALPGGQGPLVDRHATEDLAEGAGTAAHGADGITDGVASGAALLTEVVAEKDGAAGAHAAEAVGDDGAVLSDGGGEELTEGAGGAAPPRSNAVECLLGIGLTAAWGHLPDLVELVVSPVHLVKTEGSLGAGGLDLGHAYVHF